MTTKTISGTYGSNHTPTDVYVYENRNGSRWYVCEDSVNVNLTYDEIEDGTDVEEIQDVDTMTATTPINSEEELEQFIEE